MESKKKKINIHKKKSKASKKSVEFRLDESESNYNILKNKIAQLSATTPHILETTRRIEEMIKGLDEKIDSLRDYNQLQDSNIQLNRIDITKNQKVVGWVEKGIIGILVAGTVTAVLQAFFRYLF